MIYRYILKIFILLHLVACGGSSGDWDRIVDDLNYKGTGKQNCQYQASLTTQKFDGYTVSTQMPCNNWLVKVDNDSQYEVRCMMNGFVITTPSKAETDWTDIGTNTLSELNCRYHNGPIRISDVFANYVVQEQLVVGTYQFRLKNTRDYKQRCQIKNKNRKPIDTFDLQAGATSGWVSESELGFTSCRRAVN